MQKLRCKPAVGLDRCSREPSVMLQVLREADHQHIGRYRIDAGGLAHTASTQELQHLAHVVSLATPGFGENGSMSTPTAPLVPLDMDLAEISQRHSALREPPVERYCMQCLDIDDSRGVLLTGQRRDKLVEMICQRTDGAVGERGGALIGSLHDALLAGGIARQEASLCPVRMAPTRGSWADSSSAGHSPAREIVESYGLQSIGWTTTTVYTHVATEVLREVVSPIESQRTP